ncbi:hypothetical protein AAVH_26636 [Aphelenchoides avenae]|nr:hypothetical protein AAVH_26636 [Aphelenchus avenae]
MLRSTVLLVAIAASAGGFSGLTQEKCEWAGEIVDRQKTQILTSLAVDSSRSGDVAESAKYFRNIIEMINGRTICEKAIHCGDVSCVIGVTFDELLVVSKAALVGDGDGISGCNACALKERFGDFLQPLLGDVADVVLNGIIRASELTIHYV